LEGTARLHSSGRREVRRVTAAGDLGEVMVPSSRYPTT